MDLYHFYMIEVTAILTGLEETGSPVLELKIGIVPVPCRP